LNPYEELIDDFLATAVVIFQSEGKVKEVSILSCCIPEFYILLARESVYYILNLRIPVGIFNNVKDGLNQLERNINETLSLLTNVKGHTIVRVRVIPQTIHDNDWRTKTAAWLRDGVLTNQGRVRSDKVASLECDGLLFRSYPEIHLYKALKSLGVTFAPLPVFIKGGESYKRIEPDFFIIKGGKMLAIEVDGDAIHHESPLEAHKRLTILTYEGVVIERVSADDCISEEKARQCATRLLKVIDRLNI